MPSQSKTARRNDEDEFDEDGEFNAINPDPVYKGMIYTLKVGKLNPLYQIAHVQPCSAMFSHLWWGFLFRIEIDHFASGKTSGYCQTVFNRCNVLQQVLAFQSHFPGF